MNAFKRFSLPAVPMSICFILVAVMLSCALTAAVWLTLHHSATSSVNDAAQRLKYFVMADLKARVEGVLNEMSLVFRGWEATGILESVEDSPSMEQYMWMLPKNVRRIAFLSIARTDGAMWGSMPGPSGEAYFGWRAPSPPDHRNFTYFHVSDAGTISEQPAFVFSINPTERPWYAAAVKYGRPAITPPYESPLAYPMQGNLFALGIPTRFPNGTFSGAVGIAYSFDAMMDSLKEAFDALRTTGMFLLLGNDNNPIAMVANNQSSLETDIQQVQAIFYNNAARFQDMASFESQFASFGQSYVLQILFSGKSTVGFDAAGMDWKLIVILPAKDLFADIWHKNTLVAIYTVVYFVLFVGVFTGLFHILITRPLRMLVHRLRVLETAIREHRPLVEPTLITSTISSPSAHQPLEIELCEGGLSSSLSKEPVSRFSELRALHSSTMGAIVAAEEMARIRTAEAAHAMELKQAEEEAQSMMKAKDMLQT